MSQPVPAPATVPGAPAAARSAEDRPVSAPVSGPISPAAGTMHLLPATLADAERLLRWRNDPGTRAASHVGTEVAAGEHRAWLQRALADPDRRLWLAWCDDQAVGTVRADRAPGADGVVETTLSWTIAPECRGRGLGAAMLRLAVAQCGGPLRAEVRQGNTASQRLAEAAGLVLARQAGETLHYRSAG